MRKCLHIMNCRQLQKDNLDIQLGDEYLGFCGIPAEETGFFLFWILSYMQNFKTLDLQRPPKCILIPEDFMQFILLLRTFVLFRQMNKLSYMARTRSCFKSLVKPRLNFQCCSSQFNVNFTALYMLEKFQYFYIKSYFA